MSSPPFTTRVKLGLNTLLKPIGLEIGTTVKRRQELARIQKLQDKGHWTTARYTQGLEFNEQRCLDFLRHTCEAYKTAIGGFPKTANGDATEFYLDNNWFGAVDAELLYCFVRRFMPKRIVEVGSGFSTRLMRQAIRDGKLSTKITSVDPTPNTAVQPYTDVYLRSPVEDIAVSEIVDSLEEGDMLFIDSSHTLQTGADVPYLFLEVLPKLRPGVYVHVHDIFLPFDYPVEWILCDRGWTEQYLVHAFLCFNQAFQILWPARYMWEYYQPMVREVIQADSDVFPPSSLWLEKIS